MGTFNGFICDRCKREFRASSKDYNPTTIQLKISFGRTAPSNYPNIVEHVVWCEKCLTSTGFYKPKEEKDEKMAANPELTFEEKFSIIIKNLGLIFSIKE